MATMSDASDTADRNEKITSGDSAYNFLRGGVVDSEYACKWS